MSDYLPLRITVPLPPAELSKNRAIGLDPRKFRRIFHKTRNDMQLLIQNCMQHVGDPPRLDVPVLVDVVWKQAGPHQNRADPDAVIARAVSPAMDAAQACGLVANDRLISPGWISIEQAGHGEDEGVTLVFRLASQREDAA